MAIPLLYQLPKTARVAYPIIASGTRRGLSSRAIERTIREAGLPISRTRSIIPIMQSIREAEIAGRNIRFTPKSANIDLNVLPPALTNLRKGYSLNVRVRGRGSQGFIERYVTVTTDRSFITPAEVESRALTLVEGSEASSDQLEDVEVVIDSGQRQIRV